LPTILGGTVIIVPKIDRKLILDGLRKKPTVFLGFPALYGLLCLMKTAPLETIKFFVSGADMLPDKIRAAFSIVYGRKICSGYGLTESSPVIAINYLNAEHPTDVVGYPLEGIECEIRNETEQKVSHDKVGTLWVKGGNVMMGYYKAPEATEKTLKNGWLNTGDLATLSSKGILAITGRSKDLIIHKGFNIYPAEIENVLMQHPAVSRAAVIGHDDAAAGQVPIAFIATKTNDSTLEADLRIWCTSNLAAYKIPRKFICMEELPMNNTGKVDKKILRNHI
jgi:long-chain acyl-CoA synthetase